MRQEGLLNNDIFTNALYLTAFWQKEISVYSYLFSTYLFLLVVVAGECVGQSLQGSVSIASEGCHYSDQDHAFWQANDQSGDREAHHAAHVDPAWAKMTDQTTHNQGEECWGSTLQEQAQTAHTDSCKKKKKEENVTCITTRWTHEHLTQL